MKFIKALGYEDDSRSYLKFEIENGKSVYCLGDIIWCNNGTLLVSDLIDEDTLDEWADEHEISHSTYKAIKGALRRMGII